MVLMNSLLSKKLKKKLSNKEIVKILKSRSKKDIDLILKELNDKK